MSGKTQAGEAANRAASTAVRADTLGARSPGGTVSGNGTGRDGEAALVERARNGDRDAFRALFESYHQRVYAVALGIVKNRDDALEICQEAFIKVHRRLGDFQGASSFYTWLYRITWNLCVDHLRKHGRAQHVEFDESVADDPELDGAELMPARLGDDPLLSVERRELMRKMNEALAELTEPHRAILLLREVEGLSYDELADVLGINKGTVMSRLFHARRNLRRVLASYLEEGR